MKQEVFQKGALPWLRDIIISMAVTVAIAAAVFFGLEQAKQSSRTEGLRILEESLRRAVAECYAMEGRYPESIAYIESHYGVHIDTTRYAVYYEIFASNILPNITVIDWGP